MEAAYVSGLLSDMVFPKDSIKELSKHSVIVLPYIIMVGDDELANLKEYVALGGKLIILGEFATKMPDTKRRTQKMAVAALGLTACDKEQRYSGQATLDYHGRQSHFKKVTSTVLINPHEAKPILLGENGEVLGVSENVGLGEIIWLPCDIGDNDFQPPIWQNPKAPETDAARSVVDSLRENGGELLQCLVDQKTISVGAGEDVIATLFEVEEDYVVHLINTADLLPKEDTKVLRTDKIDQFSANGLKLGRFSLDITMPKLGEVRKINLYSPEFSGGRNPRFMQVDERLSIEIPEGLFSGYLLVHISVK